MPRRPRRALTSAAFAAALLSGTAAAQQDAWQFRVTPYLWASGISGKLTHPGLPTVKPSASFGDILESLDMGAMGRVEARRGRVGLVADFLHTRISDAAHVPGLGLNARFRTRTTTALVAGEYRVAENDQGYVDLLGGVRTWSLRSQVRVDALGLSHGRGARWTDPTVGVRGLYRLNPRTYLTGWAMVGAAGSSESSSDLLAGIGYALNDRTALLFAYRHLSIEYRKHGFNFDAALHGPGIGLDYRF